ncbi:hypothetical protein PMAYCL1PPCAC_33001, partial [Pristionchus mayeri]
NFSDYGSDHILLARLATFETGGIGNNVFELISSIGIARTTGRQLIVTSETYKFFKIRHPELVHLLNGVYPENERTVRAAFRIDKSKGDCCRYYGEISNEIKKKSLQPWLSARLNYLQSYLYFSNVTRREISARLELSSKAQAAIDAELAEMRQLRDAEHIICVHSRRGDYFTSGLHKPSNSEFLLGATDFVHMNSNTKSTLILLIGDDLIWQREMAEKLQETGKYAMVLPRLQSVSSPVTDWHVSRKFCDTVILTASSSTFGWWLAYLSKGQKV